MADLPSSPAGFAVLYRWRLVPGREESFRAAWARATESIRALRGGLGSCLHRADDGSFWAYAQWPDRKAWEEFQAGPTIQGDDAETMRDGIAERFDPIPLLVIEDRIAVQRAASGSADGWQ